jgi:hypothetical protein
MSDTDISYDLAIDSLLRDIPEIRPVYEIERAKWKDQLPPAHVVYGSVFVTFLRSALDRLDQSGEETDRGVVSRSFRLMEKLASSSDFETRCIVQASILESLLEDDAAYRSIAHRFGKRSNQMALKLLADWKGRPDIRIT